MNPVDIRVAPHEPWYKYGVAVLLFEMAVAIAVSGYSLYMTFNFRLHRSNWTGSESPTSLKPASRLPNWSRRESITPSQRSS
jgi:hypothetical protein